jgi:hypothetical protein
MKTNVISVIYVRIRSIFIHTYAIYVYIKKYKFTFNGLFINIFFQQDNLYEEVGFVTASVNVWAVPRKIIFVVVLTNPTQWKH